MKISKIAYEPKAVKSVQNVGQIAHTEYKQINPNEIFRMYLGRDMISFGKQETARLAALTHPEYFKLPAGCTPDLFQQEAGIEIAKDKDVIVEAPTGTGKTAIAHYATARNMANGKTTFYTTPLKALSNQKLNEFRSVYGDENVGILTGDRRENVEAPIIVMTTEVFRNMALANKYGDKNPIMDNLGTVIFDEFHYLGDPERGPVWEESIMYTPEDVQALALSATVGNAEKLKNWIGSLDGADSSLVSSSHRYVPLEFSVFETGAYKAEEKRIDNQMKKKRFVVEPQEGQNIKPQKPVPSDFKNIVNFLNKENKLPAILFVFSRKFSRELVDYFAQEGKSLTTQEEKEEIQKIINKYKSKKYIGSDLNIGAMKNGYAIHNAGIIPAQKELVEELFQKKLLKVVIATETLAAGINMPARTVVISSPYKPTDSDDEEEKTRLLSSNEFKQMSGRAGRRGIDDIGYVYTMPTDMATEQDFLCLEALPSNPINSSYNPDYAFLSEYYQYNGNTAELKNIFDKTFFSYADSKEETDKKVESLLNTSRQKTAILRKRGFIEKENGQYHLTTKGYMASKVRGYDTLNLIETMADKTFADISPEALAAVAAVFANPVKGKDAELSVGEDLTPITKSIQENVQRIYDKLNTAINQNFKRMGIDASVFTSYEQMLEAAQAISKPDASQEELYSELNTQSARRATMYTITANSGNYSLETLIKALKEGEVVPTKVLQNYSEMLEQYKSRMNTRTIDDYIEKLEAEYAAQDSSGKGSKAKARVEKNKSEIKQKIEKAKAMKFLDENIFDAMASNDRFIRKNNPSQVKKDYSNAELAYSRLSSKDELISQIKAVIGIEQYMNENDITSVNIGNIGKIAKSINKIINNSLDIHKTEAENGISPHNDRYSKVAMQAMYTWALFNQISSAGITNWKELLKVLPEKEIDEGGLYRMTMQTSDLLSQMAEIADTGAKYSDNLQEEEYYSALRETALKSRKLLIQEPVTI